MINEPQEPSLDGQGRGRLGGMVERRALTVENLRVPRVY